MMNRFPDLDESKEEYKFETPKFQVEEVVQESLKEARETQEESEETSDESGSTSEAPSESTIPFSNDSYTTMDYDDLVANLFLEEVEPLEAPLTPSETPNPEKLLSHVSVPLESMRSEGDGTSDSTQIIHQCDQNFNDSQMYISAVNFPLVFMFSVRRQMSPVSARRVPFVFRDFPIGFI